MEITKELEKILLHIEAGERAKEIALEDGYDSKTARTYAQKFLTRRSLESPKVSEKDSYKNLLRAIVESTPRYQQLVDEAKRRKYNDKRARDYALTTILVELREREEDERVNFTPSEGIMLYHPSKTVHRDKSNREN